MKISPAGRAFIERHEGRRLTAYEDQVGNWTIGVGHLLTPDEKASGTLCTGVSWRMGITEAQCDELLTWDCAWVEAALNALVEVPLTQHQFDALADFVFNEGEAHFKGSSLLALLNLLKPPANYAAAAHELKNWTYAGGKEVAALIQRRNDEIALWNTSEVMA